MPVTSKIKNTKPMRKNMNEALNMDQVLPRIVLAHE